MTACLYHRFDMRAVNPTARPHAHRWPVCGFADLFPGAGARCGGTPADRHSETVPPPQGAVAMSRLVVGTGASGGIGRATALEFARRGDRVALLARGEKGLDAAAEQVRALGAEAMTVP